MLKTRHVDWARQQGFDLVRGHTFDWGLSYDECASGRAKGDACFWPLRGYDCDAYAQVRVFWVCAVRAVCAVRVSDGLIFEWGLSLSTSPTN